MTAVVYRCYGPDGRLWYVGASTNWQQRQLTHQNTSVWWFDVARITVEEHPDRASALRAETRAIRTEHPRYNLAGRDKDRRTWSEQDYADVLVALHSRAQSSTRNRQRVERLRAEMARRFGRVLGETDLAA